VLVYQRTADLVASLLELDRRELILLRRRESDEPKLASWEQQVENLSERSEAIQAQLADILRDPAEDQLQRLLADSRSLLQSVEELTTDLEKAIGGPTEQPAVEHEQRLLSEADELIAISENLFEAAPSGLPAVSLDAEDAMLTALIQRLDLMNERGLLADDWRRVKLAADDLKSVLDLRATHLLRTDKNQPFDFDFDDSRTNLRLAFDLPLNRRAQRNSYRRALLDYQAGRRGVMRLEDSIKLDIRNGLRQLELARVQYPISVTQAALAAEQVASIRLQLALGISGVRGTDLLDALQSSRQALTSVANARIGYLVDRAQFAFDLELLQLDEEGFWPSIADFDYQPAADLVYPGRAGPTYGEISPCVKPSRLMYHIYCHPRPGEFVMYESDEVPSALAVRVGHSESHR
jgi:hypothetical protein